VTTPSCANCGAKFAHDRELMRCRKCLLPDEVADKGAEAIHAWVEQTNRNKLLFGRHHAKLERTARQVALVLTGKRQAKKAMKAGRQRRRNKHGRSGARA
jgi:hypothetical protein